MTHDKDRERGQQEGSVCCGRGNAQTDSRSRPKDEANVEPRKKGCCG